MKRGFNEFQWKIVALIFMLLDHLKSYLLLFPAWVGLLTRFVAPLFVYFLVEGFHHTKSKRGYAFRLYICAFITFLGNITINYFFHNVDRLTGEMTFFSLLAGNNILWTLAIFFSIMLCLAKAPQAISFRKILFYLLAALLGIFSLVLCEGGVYLLPLLLLFYYCYGEKNKICAGVILWSLLLFSQAWYNFASGASQCSLAATLCFDSQWMMVTFLVPLLGYNGEAGKQKAWHKWLFYVIYPFHLWVLLILRYMLQ